MTSKKRGGRGVCTLNSQKIRGKHVPHDPEGPGARFMKSVLSIIVS